MSTFKEEEFTKRFDPGVWLKLKDFAKEYKKQFFALILVMVFVGGIDAIFPLVTRHVIDNYIVPGKSNKLMNFGIFFGILTIVQSINVWLLIVIAGKIETGLRYNIGKAGFKKLQELSFSYYDKTPIGWIMARMTSDIHKLGSTIAWGLVDMVWGFSMMTGVLIAMFWLNWKLALTVCIILPMLVAVSNFFQHKILKSYREVKSTNSKITALYNEGITGAVTTKTLGCENESIGEFKGLTCNMYRSSVQAAIFSSLYLPIVVTIGSIGLGIVVWSGGGSVIAGTITYGTLVAFISYTLQFFDPVREVARIFAELQSAQASAERIITLINTEPEIANSDKSLENIGAEKINGEIEFENVSFHYKKNEPVLQNFNLKIKAGEKIAIVGETGSGKSTLVNLACRFYEPVTGKIKIDGTDYKDRTLKWLHSNLGYVLQSPHLFSGTIRDNIRYGKLDASDEDIENAAKLVNAHEFIMEFEKGYDTEVGEGGGMLSTGQKQLISFARAIISNPQIFVLDEATSSVDTETEKLIQEAVDKVLHGRTSFIIAHRLSTIRSADRILLLKKGVIVEEGTHHDLIMKKGYYYKLYTNQFMEEHETEILNNAVIA